MTRDNIRRVIDKRHWNRKSSKDNDLISKVKEFLSIPNSQWYMYVGIVIIAYVFYQLGYSFLYGFYFGGDKLFASLMDIMVNQVPFDFITLALTGTVISICFFAIVLH